MIVLGLDLSTKTGVAVVDEKKNILYANEIEFKKLKGWERVSAILASIMEAHEKYKPDLVIIEELFIGRASSAIVLAEISVPVKYYLWQENIKFTTVPATSLKKWLTSKGNAQKDTMMMEVYKQFGYTSRTNNEADAVALAMLGQCILGVQFPAPQISVMQKIVKIS